MRELVLPDGTIIRAIRDQMRESGRVFYTARIITPESQTYEISNPRNTELMEFDDPEWALRYGDGVYGRLFIQTKAPKEIDRLREVKS